MEFTSISMAISAPVKSVNSSAFTFEVNESKLPFTLDTIICLTSKPIFELALSIFQSANYISSFIFYELIYLELGIIIGYNLDVYQILCFPQNISVYLKQKSEFR